MRIAESTDNHWDEIQMLNILLADDSLPSVAAGQAMLEQMGHNVTIAHCGEEALGCALAQQFDLIILDEYMPGMDGSQVAQAIRRSKAPNTMVPIVSLSGASSESRISQILDSGIDGCLSKPVTFDQLVKIIDKFATTSSYTVETEVVGQMKADLGAEVVAKLLKLFAEEIQNLSARLTVAIEKGDVEEVHAVVHIWKNSAALYGARTLADLSRQLNETPPEGREQFMRAAEDVLHAAKETWKSVRTVSA